ncbi:MAG: sensor histidine kinase [Planctomycetota bacterium]
MHVLLAEHDATTRLLIGSLLRGWGYSVCTCADGSSALGHLESEGGPPLALLDQDMPGADAVAICRHLRARPPLRRPYLIVLSSRYGEKDVVQALDAGADDHLVKPCARGELRARLGVGERVLLLQGDLLRQNADLEQLAEARAQELLHARRLAVLGTLSAGVAHEINNPITFIAGNLQVLEQCWGMCQPEQSGCSLDQSFCRREVPEILASMRRGVERVSRIVDLLRNYARKPEHELPDVADLSAAISTALELCGKQLEKSLAVSVELDADLPSVGCDAQSLEQVLVNLLTNAADAIPPPRRGHCWLRARRAAERIAIAICDDGCGMTPEQRASCFDPFFTTKPPGSGTGLGLSISQRLITEHAGSLDVQERPGGGTCFNLELPVAGGLA